MRIETVSIDALDGARLEADLARVDEPIASVVLAHPHPQYGGDRFNPVIDLLFRALPDAGISTVRFDFRGVNASTGEHDHGDAERLDIVAGIELLDMVATASGASGAEAPLWLVGYSFGAMVSLNVVDPRVHGWIAIAPPVAAMPMTCLAGADHRPKLVFAAAHDQFSPPAATAAVTDTWRSTEQRTIEMADHFLGGRIGWVTGEIVQYLTGSA